MDGSSIDTAFRLAELIASRLCHDLSGPLNGLTTVQDDSEEEPTLAEEAATVTINRLILLRAAWGEPGGQLRREDIARLVVGLPRRRTQVDLAGIDANTVFDPKAGRFLLNVILLCSEAMPRGGTLRLEGSQAAGVVARIDGPNVAWPEGLTAMIVSPDAILATLEEVSPRNLQLPFTLLMAHATGQQLSMLLGGGATATPPIMIRFAAE